MEDDIARINKFDLFEGRTIDISDPNSRYYQIVLHKGELKINYHGNYFILHENEMAFLPKYKKCTIEVASNATGHLILWKSLNEICENIQDDISKYDILHHIHQHVNNYQHLSEDQDRSSLCHILPLNDQVKSILDTIDLYRQNHYDRDTGIFKQLCYIKQQELLIVMGISYSKDDILDFIFKGIELDEKTQFKAFILMNKKNTFHVKDFANKYNCSVSTFQRKFQKYFNANPSEYLKNHRIKSLKNLLKDPYISYKEITDKLQFSSQAHMCSFCKKHIGETPADFRERRRELTEKLIK